jgi:MFS family permease
VRGFTPLHAGLLTLPMAAAAGVAAPLSGRLVGARGPRLPLVLGGAAIVASGLLLTQLAAGTPIGYLGVAYLLFGAGFGLINAPITNAAVSGMPQAQAGVAAAVASTSRQVGATLGVAVFGSVVAGVATGAFPAASHLGWWIMVGAGVTVLVLGVLTTGTWARRTAVLAVS